MFGNNRGGFLASIPPVTKNLIIINLIVWLAEALFPRFSDTLIRVLGLHLISASNFNPVQIVTYMFLHSPSSPLHVLFNMFTLWMFGSTLERIWGSKRFFAFYFICGIGAAIVQEIVWGLSWSHEYVSGIASFKNQMVTIGASGAVYGLLLGYAFVFPDQHLYLFFIPVPITAKYMMIGYGVLEFFLGVGGSDMIAHFAHLGGMLFGHAILLYWKNKGTFRGGRFY